MVQVNGEERLTVAPVHITSVSPGVTLGKSEEKIKEVVQAYNSYPLNIGALPSQVLQHSPNRKRAELILNGTGVVALAKTQADCQSAVGNAINEVTGNVTVIYAAEYNSALQIKGTSELWAVLLLATDPIPTETVEYTPTQPAVPATGVAIQNPAPIGQTVVINANGATISAVVVNGITVGSGAGTYLVPAYGAISISYTIATPTWVWSNTPAVVTQPTIPTVISVIKETTL